MSDYFEMNVSMYTLLYIVEEILFVTMNAKRERVSE